MFILNCNRSFVIAIFVLFYTIVVLYFSGFGQTTWQEIIGSPYDQSPSLKLPESGKEDSRNIEDVSAEAVDLYKAWTRMYGLDKANPPKEIKPKSRWIMGSKYPLAPHLEDCEYVTNERRTMDNWGADGNPPPWLHPQQLQDADPPWVHGSNSDTTTMTRYTQAYIWKHQHPEDCAAPHLTFAIIPWETVKDHGLGSTLHVMAHYISRAMHHGRIVVDKPETFDRALNKNCQGSDYGSLSCFYFSLVTPECQKVALELYEKQVKEEALGGMGDDPKKFDFRSNLRVVFINDVKSKYYRWSYWFPSELNETWIDDQISVEHLGSTLKYSDKNEYDKDERLINVMSRHLLAAIFSKSQILRYMLRFPSLSLCHETNKVRHESFGLEVAEDTVQTVAGMKLSVEFSKMYGQEGELETLGNIDLSKNPLEKTLWKTAEPYLPRPIISVHVRLSDKGNEMKLFSLGTHMWMAERIRRHVPNVRNIWLTTEYEPVINRTTFFKRWKFYYANTPRITTKSQPEAELNDDALGRLTVLTFANLEIAQKCDYFVGALASNWARVINELRLTNGRRKSGFIALNFDES